MHARPACPPARLQDLNCAPGKFKPLQGCTACPAGKRLKRIQSILVAESDRMQFQAVGKGCY